MKQTLYYIASWLRFSVVFYCLRYFSGIRGLHRIVGIFDPNNIRKNVNYVANEKLMRISKNGWVLVVDVNDHIGYWSFIRNEPFENSVHAIGKRLGLGDNDIVLDIGANIGTASVPLCSESGCELIAIEASKRSGLLLIKNMLLNKIKAHVYLFALSNQNNNGYLPLYVRAGNIGTSSLHRDWNPSVFDSDPELVPTMKLDDLLGQSDLVKRIKLIKIDVEGAELDVIRSGVRFFETNTAPIIMEYRIDAIKKYLNTDMTDLLNFMENYYVVRALDSQFREVDFDANKSYENIIFKRK